MRISKQSHSAERLERGDPLGLWNFSMLQNIRKLEGGPKKFEKKVAQCRKKIKGGPVVPSGFVSFVKN